MDYSCDDSPATNLIHGSSKRITNERSFNDPARVNLVERIRKLRLPTTQPSSGGQLLRVLREQMRRKPKTMYVDRHKPETSAISSEGNRQVTVADQRHSCSRSVE
ncbi:hypothetical protein [Bradyrhizobium acaciae]|uniref:hypothetical protein n=1 Tax=Bradyrhizobium acaciae TaxID=2683706 RepID=UPI001E4F3EEC|nr:hypothetical protein [Bradyrhizobium acaciae]MCC8978656.1 hypothetical protein [Bradyrhizobium acaciae]